MKISKFKEYWLNKKEDEKEETDSGISKFKNFWFNTNKTKEPELIDELYDELEATEESLVELDDKLVTAELEEKLDIEDEKKEVEIKRFQTAAMISNLTKMQKSSGLDDEDLEKTYQTILNKEEDNPWAICTASVGRENDDKYERCVQHVKRDLGYDKATKYRKTKNSYQKSMVIEGKKPDGETSTQVIPDEDFGSVIQELTSRGYTEIKNKETGEVYYSKGKKYQKDIIDELVDDASDEAQLPNMDTIDNIVIERGYTVNQSDKKEALRRWHERRSKTKKSTVRKDNILDAANKVRDLINEAKQTNNRFASIYDVAEKLENSKGYKYNQGDINQALAVLGGEWKLSKATIQAKDAKPGMKAGDSIVEDVKIEGDKIKIYWDDGLISMLGPEETIITKRKVSKSLKDEVDGFIRSNSTLVVGLGVGALVYYLSKKFMTKPKEIEEILSDTQIKKTILKSKLDSILKKSKVSRQELENAVELYREEGLRGYALEEAIVTLYGESARSMLQTLDKSRIIKKLDSIVKQVDTSYAGDVPESLLARQDLEGDDVEKGQHSLSAGEYVVTIHERPGGRYSVEVKDRKNNKRVDIFGGFITLSAALAEAKNLVHEYTTKKNITKSKYNLSDIEQAELKIARNVMNMPDAAVPFSGYHGTKEDAKQRIKELEAKMKKSNNKLEKNYALDNKFNYKGHNIEVWGVEIDSNGYPEGYAVEIDGKDIHELVDVRDEGPIKRWIDSNLTKMRKTSDNNFTYKGHNINVQSTGIDSNGYSIYDVKIDGKSITELADVWRESQIKRWIDSNLAKMRKSKEIDSFSYNGHSVRVIATEMDDSFPLSWIVKIDGNEVRELADYQDESRVRRWIDTNLEKMKKSNVAPDENYQVKAWDEDGLMQVWGKGTKQEMEKLKNELVKQYPPNLVQVSIRKNKQTLKSKLDELEESLTKAITDDEAERMILDGHVDKLRARLVNEDGLSTSDANTKIAELRKGLRKKMIKSKLGALYKKLSKSDDPVTALNEALEEQKENFEEREDNRKETVDKSRNVEIKKEGNIYCIYVDGKKITEHDTLRSAKLAAITLDENFNKDDQEKIHELADEIKDESSKLDEKIHKKDSKFEVKEDVDGKWLVLINGIVSAEHETKADALKEAKFLENYLNKSQGITTKISKKDSNIEVKEDEFGGWVVYDDGAAVSEHDTKSQAVREAKYLEEDFENLDKSVPDKQKVFDFLDKYWLSSKNTDFAVPAIQQEFNIGQSDAREFLAQWRETH